MATDYGKEKLLVLFVGQSFDLHWTYNTKQPSILQYLQMIDSSKPRACFFFFDFALTKSETGALFQLLSHLMSANATVNKDVNLDSLSTLLGRYFQIRDDYQNLKSAVVNLQARIPSSHFLTRNSTQAKKDSAKIWTRENIPYRYCTFFRRR